MPRNVPGSKSQDAEFYVGYLRRAPKSLARTTTGIIAALAVLGLVIGLVLVFGQQPFPRSTFEFQQYREFTGLVETNPYPALLVQRPGAAAEQSPYSRYLLVAPGKHGADSDVHGLAGKRVSLRGSLIYRDGQTMIELLPGSLVPKSSTPASQFAETPLGEVKVIGEIVDSKCYLGVMNPGRTKVHRDCAARCISGGIPPMLVTGDATYLMVGADGRQLNLEVLDMVGEAIEVRGTAVRAGETVSIKSEPATYRRVTSSKE